jgi:hypothetical protein
VKGGLAFISFANLLEEYKIRKSEIGLPEICYFDGLMVAKEVLGL